MDKLERLRDMENNFLFYHYMGKAHIDELNRIKHYIECYYTIDEELSYYKKYYNEDFNIEIYANDYGFDFYSKVKKEDDEISSFLSNPKLIRSFDYFRLFATDRLTSKEEIQKLSKFIRFYPDYYEGLNKDSISEDKLMHFKKSYVEGCVKECSRYSFNTIKASKEDILREVGGKYIFRLAKGIDILSPEFAYDMIYDSSFLQDLYVVDKEVCHELITKYTKNSAKDNDKLSILFKWIEDLKENNKKELADFIYNMIISEVRNSITKKPDRRRKK